MSFWKVIPQVTLKEKTDDLIKVWLWQIWTMVLVINDELHVNPLRRNIVEAIITSGVDLLPLRSQWNGLGYWCLSSFGSASATRSSHKPIGPTSPTSHRIFQQNSPCKTSSNSNIILPINMNQSLLVMANHSWHETLGSLTGANFANVSLVTA